jgi:glucosamine kinase
MQATERAMESADMPVSASDIVACLALAGASEPSHLDAARGHPLPFYHTMITTDAHAACVGAHSGASGGIIIIGTGSVGWGLAGGCEHRVGGWGFPISDEGSGAWLGSELVRRVLWAFDGRLAWTDMLRHVLSQFDGDPHAIVRWMTTARPRDFGAMAPTVIEFAAQDDPIACELMRTAAQYVDGMAAELGARGIQRLSLSGGLSRPILPWLSPATRQMLVEPSGDTLSGALQIARDEARALAAAQTAVGH